MRLIDFKTCLGRIGDHPGEPRNPMLMRDAFALAQNSNCDVIEIGATTGRSTALLGVALKNAGKILHVVKIKGDPLADIWFSRAIIGHRLTGTVNLFQDEDICLPLAFVSGGLSSDAATCILQHVGNGGRVAFLCDGPVLDEVVERARLEPGPNAGTVRVFVKSGDCIKRVSLNPEGDV